MYLPFELEEKLRDMILKFGLDEQCSFMLDELSEIFQEYLDAFEQEIKEKLSNERKIL